MRILACMSLTALLLTCKGGTLPSFQTVFIILMENEDWSAIQGNPVAPYINNTLLPGASYCEQYFTPPGLHPSLPNYLWLEAGTNFGILDDNAPSSDHQNTAAHLVTLLEKAGVSWKTYQENIAGTSVPLTDNYPYAVRHDPFVYFDDVTGTNDANFAYGIAHIRPYTEFASDLASNAVARYNFITPNLCDDMHDSCAPLNDPIRQGDNWLATEVPRILGSPAYMDGGVLFITWDEGSSGPIGMIVLSSQARGEGYRNWICYTHSSTLRTMQEIFGVSPLLGDAATATDLSDLFCRYRLSSILKDGAGVTLTASGVLPERTNIVQTSSDLADWRSIATNVVPTNTFTLTDLATNLQARFYRLVQTP
jgi:phosphatidylinositol-3-phosphatase